MKRYALTALSLLVFAVLLAIVLWPQSDSESKALWSIDFNDIVQIEILQRGAVGLILKKEADVWRVKENKELDPLDKDSIQQRFSPLLNLKSEGVFSKEEVDSLKSYGLEPPERVLTFALADGSEYSLLIGIKTPLGRHYYVRLREEGPIHLAPAFDLREELGGLEGLQKAKDTEVH